VSSDTNIAPATSQWAASYSSGVTLSYPAGAEYAFKFPDEGHVNMITKRGVPLGKSITISGRIQASGGQFNSLDRCAGGLPATVRVYLEQDMGGEFGRWWSNPEAVVLKDGTFTLTVPISPEHWQSVYGKMGTAAPQEFANFMKRTSYAMGLTFGGGCSFGHGVRYRGGAATFTLNTYRTQ
jgi:hypothetical protein